MRLERLEISGFKSFPDRADLAFDRGVTAIVGPNGCGKSNVVDAITWVLGEQSAKSLRGERMEDVIFAGSDARKATAAAEVRLKLGGVTVRPGMDVDAVIAGQWRGHAQRPPAHGDGSVDGAARRRRAGGRRRSRSAVRGRARAGAAANRAPGGGRAAPVSLRVKANT